jgi:hypothetical protein
MGVELRWTWGAELRAQEILLDRMGGNQPCFGAASYSILLCFLLYCCLACGF